MLYYYTTNHTEEHKKEVLSQINDYLETNFIESDYDKVFYIISEYFGKLILRDWKEDDKNIKIEDLLRTNYLLNVVTNYGTLDRNPGSLIHFYSFKDNKLEERKKILLKKIKKKLLKKTTKKIKKLEEKLLILKTKFKGKVK